MHIIGFPLCRILVTIRNQATIVPFLVYALLTLIELTCCFLVFLVPQLDQVLQGQRLENPGHFNAMDEGEGDGGGKTSSNSLLTPELDGKVQMESVQQNLSN